jgi:hypothetical protein
MLEGQSVTPIPITFELRLKRDGAPETEHFAPVLDLLAEKLAETDGVLDPFIGGDLELGIMTVVLSVEAEDELAAIEKASRLLRAASQHVLNGPSHEVKRDDGKSLIGKWRFYRVSGSTELASA